MIEELEGCRIIDKRGIAMVSLIVLLVLTGFEVVFYSDIRSLNQRAYDYFYNSINVELMSLISFTAGGGLVIAVIGLLATDLYRYRRLTMVSVGVISSLALSMIIVFTPKITLQVPRPSGGSLTLKV
ncbi:MAG: hypothetical protein F7B78_01080 [Desulfurococcales archaeon]|nr:hypothetical protein [Desulfurococcales archaeon]